MPPYSTLSDVVTLPCLPFTHRDKLPVIGAVYFVVLFDRYSIPKELCYVGKAHNLYLRWFNHHRAPQMWFRHCIFWHVCDNDEDRSELESSLIESLKPSWNDVTMNQTIRKLTQELAAAQQEIFLLRRKVESLQNAISIQKEI